MWFRLRVWGLGQEFGVWASYEPARIPPSALCSGVLPLRERQGGRGGGERERKREKEKERKRERGSRREKMCVCVWCAYERAHTHVSHTCLTRVSHVTHTSSMICFFPLSLSLSPHPPTICKPNFDRSVSSDTTSCMLSRATATTACLSFSRCSAQTCRRSPSGATGFSSLFSRSARVLPLARAPLAHRCVSDVVTRVQPVV